jgi:lipid-A-disaccharide synthase
MTDLFILAGEHSGDLHASNLIKALKRQCPEVQLRGVAGPKMRDEGVDPLLHMEDFELMGFAQIAAGLPKVWKQFRYLQNHILHTQPKSVVLIDYPGFNIRLAQSLRKKGYQGRIVQYICPAVWAWGKNRIPKMAQSLDMLLTIFPFEPPIFSHTSLKAQFVGHPLIDSIDKHVYKKDWSEKIGLDPQEHILAVFPGSRHMEISHNLHKQLYAAKKLLAYKPKTKIAISCSRPKFEELIQQQIAAHGLSLGKDAYIVPSDCSYELMRACNTAIAKSGTVNLELALHGKPSVVVYEVYLLNAFIIRYLLGVNLPYYSIVNILGGKEIFPELITYRYSQEKLAKTVREMDDDTPMRRTALQGCQEIAGMLQGYSASEEAAKAILKF